MAGIPINSNFDVSTYNPIDSRLVATGSSAKDNIVYKYQGLRVYQTDVNEFFTWNGSTWSTDTNGIYGGSGSLVGNTVVKFGTIGNTVSSQSSYFSMNGLMSSGTAYLTSYFNRHTNGSDWSGVEYRMQYTHDTDTSNTIYISYNPPDSLGNQGGMDIGTGNKARVSIKSDGTFRLWNPTYSADFISTSLTYSTVYNLPSKSGTLALTSDISTSIINTVTYSSYTLASTDNGSILLINGTCSITIPSGLGSIGSKIDSIRMGSGPVSFTWSSPVIVDSQTSYRSIAAQYVGVSVIQISTNNWILIGNLAP